MSQGQGAGISGKHASAMMQKAIAIGWNLAVRRSAVSIAEPSHLDLCFFSGKTTKSGGRLLLLNPGNLSTMHLVSELHSEWGQYNDRMAVKAVVADGAGTQHLIIGLNRKNVNLLLGGEVFVLPQGVTVSLTEQSDIVIMFAETDEELRKRFPPSLRPV